jgi:cold shock CspA family protein
MSQLNLNFDELEDREYTRPPAPSTKRKSAEDNRVTGAIRKLKEDRGYGFIAGDDGVDYFFIWAGMEKTTKNFRDLVLLDRVSFIPIAGDKGPKAIQIRVL